MGDAGAIVYRGRLRKGSLRIVVQRYGVQFGLSICLRPGGRVKARPTAATAGVERVIGSVAASTTALLRNARVGRLARLSI